MACNKVLRLQGELKSHEQVINRMQAFEERMEAQQEQLVNHMRNLEQRIQAQEQAKHSGEHNCVSYEINACVRLAYQPPPHPTPCAP